MDSVVIDSSVAIKWFFEEPDWERARQILADGQAGNLELIAPDFILTELANVIWKKHRIEGLDATDAQRIYKQARAISCTLLPAVDLLDDAFELAMVHGRTVYDMLYVALS